MVFPEERAKETKHVARILLFRFDAKDGGNATDLQNGVAGWRGRKAGKCFASKKHKDKTKALNLLPHSNGRSPSQALDLGDFQGAAPLEPSEIIMVSLPSSEASRS